MCSLSVSLNNSLTRIYEDPLDLVGWLASEMASHEVIPEIECFDLRHLHQAMAIHSDGRLSNWLYCQFVTGVRNALPADRHAFEAMLAAKRYLSGDAPWRAPGWDDIRRRSLTWPSRLKGMCAPA